MRDCPHTLFITRQRDCRYWYFIGVLHWPWCYQIKFLIISTWFLCCRLWYLNTYNRCLFTFFLWTFVAIITSTGIGKYFLQELWRATGRCLEIHAIHTSFAWLLLEEISMFLFSSRLRIIRTVRASRSYSRKLSSRRRINIRRLFFLNLFIPWRNCL